MVEAGKPFGPIPQPAGTDWMSGAGRVAAGALESLETPEGFVTLPAFGASKLVRGLTAAQMLASVPEGPKPAWPRLLDDHASAADKLEAMGNPVVASVTAALLANHGAPKPSGVLPTEETGGKISPPIELPQPEGEPNAPQVLEKQAGVPVQSEGTVEGQAPQETGAGDSVLSPTPTKEEVAPKFPVEQPAVEAGTHKRETIKESPSDDYTRFQQLTDQFKALTQELKAAPPEKKDGGLAGHVRQAAASSAGKWRRSRTATAGCPPSRPNQWLQKMQRLNQPSRNP